jgi:hypothetical protein
MRYSGVIGTFTVPVFSGSGTNAAVWVGIDGARNSAFGPQAEVIQSGIECEPGRNPKCQSWGEYYAQGWVIGQFGDWSTKFIPSNYTTTQGHSMTFYAWEGNAQCLFGYPNDVGYGCFWWIDNSNGNATTNAMPPNQPPIGDPLGYGTFTGARCEGIIERQDPARWPHSWLPSWSSASIQFDCLDYVGGTHNLGSSPAPFGEPFLDYKMIRSASDPTPLANAFKTGSDVVTFNFILSH